MRTLEEVLQAKFFKYLNTKKSTSYIMAMEMARLALETEEEYYLRRQEADRETHVGEKYE